MTSSYLFLSCTSSYVPLFVSRRAVPCHALSVRKLSYTPSCVFVCVQEGNVMSCLSVACENQHAELMRHLVSKVGGKPLVEVTDKVYIAPICMCIYICMYVKQLVEITDKVLNALICV
jgi:hypothetical protein